MKNGHNSKIWDDMILKFFQNVLNRFVLKIKEEWLETIYWHEVNDNLLIPPNIR